MEMNEQDDSSANAFPPRGAFVLLSFEQLEKEFKVRYDNFIFIFDRGMNHSVCSDSCPPYL